ncbi:MAG: hypothetical protein M3004_05395 [Bacteroidota bacterium]|nr:hypothetical protein [Bacteroidota bacterium]
MTKQIMKGVNYITDERGNKTAVVINLKNYKEEIEDFLDGLEAQNRMQEPSVDFEKAVTKILKAKSSNGKLSAKNKKIS